MTVFSIPSSLRLSAANFSSVGRTSDRMMDRSSGVNRVALGYAKLYSSNVGTLVISNSDLICAADSASRGIRMKSQRPNSSIVLISAKLVATRMHSSDPPNVYSMINGREDIRLLAFNLSTRFSSHFTGFHHSPRVTTRLPLSASR